MTGPKKDLATPEGQNLLLGYLSRCIDIIQAELPADLQPMIVLVHKTEPQVCAAVGLPTRPAAIAALEFLETGGTEVLVNRSGLLVSADDEPAAGESVQ